MRRIFHRLFPNIDVQRDLIIGIIYSSAFLVDEAMPVITPSSTKTSVKRFTQNVKTIYFYKIS
jgi:hypothetical protein